MRGLATQTPRVPATLAAHTLCSSKYVQSVTCKGNQPLLTYGIRKAKGRPYEIKRKTVGDRESAKGTGSQRSVLIRVDKRSRCN